MNIDRIKEIQQQTAYPDSKSVQQALIQVWNECEQERDRRTTDFEPNYNFVEDLDYGASRDQFSDK